MKAIKGQHVQSENPHSSSMYFQEIIPQLNNASAERSTQDITMNKGKGKCSANMKLYLAATSLQLPLNMQSLVLHLLTTAGSML